MRFSEIRLENIGPIDLAEIGRHRLSVFMGPNNSGKSVASRIVHGVCQLAPPGGDGGRGAAAERSAALARSAGTGRADAAARPGRVVVRDGAGTRTVIDLGSGAGARASGPGAPPGGDAKSSVYVPAGRVGAVQTILALARAGGGAQGPGAAAPATGAGPHAPEHLAQFYSVVLEALSGGLGEEAADLFSRVLRGSLRRPAAGGAPGALYCDPSGFATEVGSAGLGVVSTFCIVAAMEQVGPGGTLIVEDPDAHMDPMGQIRLVTEAVRIAQGRGVSLVLVTHSDYVVNTVMNQVYNKLVAPSDLGLYYFRRGREERTRVERVPSNIAGEIEMEMFDEALDALLKGSVISDYP